MERTRNCQEPKLFAAADDLYAALAAIPPGVDRRELQTVFRNVGDQHHYMDGAAMMQALHLLEYAGRVVVHRDGKRSIRLVRARVS